MSCSYGLPNWYTDFQALVAISQVTKHAFNSANRDLFPIKPVDYGRFLVISIGTGTAKVEMKYNAKKAAKWGVLCWLMQGGSSPIVDVFTQASADMVDFHNSVFFQALHSQDNYLRIQVIPLILYFVPSILLSVLSGDSKIFLLTIL